MVRRRVADQVFLARREHVSLRRTLPRRAARGAKSKGVLPRASTTLRDRSGAGLDRHPTPTTIWPMRCRDRGSGDGDRPRPLCRRHFLPHQLDMRIARSPVACGMIVAVETGAARALPGVAAVWTAADVADVLPIDFREGRIERLEPYRQPVLARDRVRYVGEPVAAVFAADPYVAEDAADLIDTGSRRCRRCSMPRPRPESSRPAAAPRPPSCARAMATLRPQWRPPGRWSNSTFRLAATPAFRSKPGVRSAATTPRATSSNCMAPPRCRTGCATCLP